MSRLTAPITRIIDWPASSDEQKVALRNLIQSIFAEPPYSKMLTDAYVENWFQEGAADGVFLTAGESDHPLGFCIALPLMQSSAGSLVEHLKLESPENVWYIGELGIKKEARRQGLASRLLLKIRSHYPATAQGELIRTLTINSGAIALYQKLGFQKLEYIQTHDAQTGDSIRDRVFLFHKIEA